MPNATITPLTVTGPWTRDQLATALKTQMGVAGWTLDSETSSASTPYTIRWRRVYNAGVTYGTAYLMVFFQNAGGTSATLAMGYQNTTSSSPLNWTSLTASTDITLYAINHPEVSGVLFKQGSTVSRLLCIRPANKPTEWNENNFLYAFHQPQSTVLVSLQPTALSLTCTWLRAVTSLNNANALTGNYDVITRLAVGSDKIFCGSFTSDVCTCQYPSGITIADTLQDISAGKTYFIVFDGICLITSGSVVP